jgi:hypothetical protein
MLNKLNRQKEAEAAYRDALPLRQQLAEDLPTIYHYRHELAQTLVNLAGLLRDRQEFAAARALLDQAQPHQHAALKANPKYPTYRQLYRINRATLASILAGLGEPDAAIQTAEELAGLSWDPLTDTYDAACALALCVAVVESATQLPETQRTQLAQSFGERALAMLRQAVERGYKDVAHLKKDADLASLRSRADFQKLVQELEAKSEGKQG